MLKKTDHGLVMLCQLRKALLQMALDNGEWRKAQMLLLYEDPQAKPEWAGEAKELQAIHKHYKAIKQLKEGDKPDPKKKTKDEQTEKKE